MSRLRHLVRIGSQLVRYAALHRAWWILGLVLLLAVASLLAAAGHVAAPYTLYTLF